MHSPYGAPPEVSRSEISNPVSRRIVGLDVLRSIAMLLGVVLHAAAGYMSELPDGLLWPVRDTTCSVCDAIYRWIHAFRLPLFFVLAGYFAEFLSTMRSPDEFMRHRVERLVWPYLLSLVTVGPLTLGISIWGWHVSGICTFSALIDTARPLPTELTTAGFGPGHLWFLQDLILMSAGFWVVRRNFEPRKTHGESFELGSPCLLPLACALPTALLLAGNPEPLIAFRNTFLPVPSRLLYYGTFFSWGVVFRRSGEISKLCIMYRNYFLMAGIAFSVPMIPATMLYEREPDLTTGIVMVLSTAGFAWLFIFGWFGVFLRDFTASERIGRYLSDSSYWVYLVHLPIVLALQILLIPVAIAPVSKVFVISLATFAISIATYAGYVRYTWIGRMLHGVRHRGNK